MSAGSLPKRGASPSFHPGYGFVPSFFLFLPVILITALCPLEPPGRLIETLYPLRSAQAYPAVRKLSGSTMKSAWSLWSSGRRSCHIHLPLCSSTHFPVIHSSQG